MANLYQTIYSRACAIEPDTVKTMMDLIGTPSLCAHEKEIAQVVCRELQEAGADEIRIDGLGNVIGRIGNGPLKIAFDGHLDTVDTGDLSQWTFDPFQPKVENGKVFGRGSVDQKGGLAAMISAARLIRELHLNEKLTLYFTFTVMEEDCEGLNWQYLIHEENIRPDFVVITEPTNLHLYRGHRGRVEMSVDVRGRSAHSSLPEMGDNAIYKMARIILEIEKMNHEFRADIIMGKGSISVTEVHSSSPSICAVPDGARFRIDRRLTIGESKEKAVAEVTGAVRRAGYENAKVSVLTYEEPSYTGKVYPAEKFYPTWMLDENSPYLKNCFETYSGLFGEVPSVGFCSFSTNGVAIAGLHHIPCVLCGPGNERVAHTPDEACEINQVTRAAALYAALVAKLNGKI